MKMLLFVGAAVLFSVGSAHAAGPPDVKEGLWSDHTQSIDQPGNKKSEGTKTICRSHAYDQYVKTLAAKVPGCTKVSENYNGHTFTSEMRCVVGGSVIDGKETATFQGDTAVHSESHSTYTPALYGVSATTRIADQKYLGSCPAGSQPGDIKSADGKIINTWKH
jgi:hypothetical protein